MCLVRKDQGMFTPMECWKGKATDFLLEKWVFLLSTVSLYLNMLYHHRTYVLHAKRRASRVSNVILCFGFVLCYLSPLPPWEMLHTKPRAVLRVPGILLRYIYCVQLTSKQPSDELWMTTSALCVGHIRWRSVGRSVAGPFTLVLFFVFFHFLSSRSFFFSGVFLPRFVTSQMYRLI